MKLSNLIKKINKENAPEASKLYALTGAQARAALRTDTVGRTLR